MSTLNKDTKLFFPSNQLLLDSLNYEKIPSKDFVVSKNHEGEAISFYGDLIWDFTVYHSDGKPSNLIFIFWDQGGLTHARKKLINEIKHIFFILIWLREKNPLSLGTLRNYLTIVRQVAKFAENKNCSLKDVIGNSLIFLEFVRSQSSGWFIETLSSRTYVQVIFSVFKEFDNWMADQEPRLAIEFTDWHKRFLQYRINQEE